MNNRPLILVAEQMMAQTLDILRPAYDALPFWEEAGRARSAEARAIVTGGKLRIDSKLLDSMPRLGLIAVVSTGYDNVDVAAARERGIAITTGQGANAEDVADQAIALLLAHRRRIIDGDARVRSGGWASEGLVIGRSIGGAQIGIAGMGQIGQAVARRAEAMRMAVSWWGPRPKPDLPWRRSDSLEALARESDILVIAARGDQANYGMISAPIIDALGPDGLLVNVGRGQLVDEDALIAALRGHRLGGAALDVFVTEPAPPERWADVPHCIFATHSGGATDRSVTEMPALMMRNLSAFFAGEPLLTALS